MSRSHKIYGRIVRTQREKKGITQLRLEEMANISRRTIQYIEQANRENVSPPKYETRNLLAKHLGLPILGAFPPNIDDFSLLLTERFEFERESVIYFTQEYYQNSVDEIGMISRLYQLAIERNDLHKKGLADRYLHTIIAGAHPNLEKKAAISANQSSYINFFEIWLPYLDPDVNFHNSRDINIPIHQKLFSACLSGNGNQMEEALDAHLQASLQDIQAIINWIDKS